MSIRHTLSKHVKAGSPPAKRHFKWRFACGPIVARNWMLVGLLSTDYLSMKLLYLFQMLKIDDRRETIPTVLSISCFQILQKRFIVQLAVGQMKSILFPLITRKHIAVTSSNSLQERANIQMHVNVQVLIRKLSTLFCHYEARTTNYQT